MVVLDRMFRAERQLEKLEHVLHELSSHHKTVMPQLLLLKLLIEPV